MGAIMTSVLSPRSDKSSNKTSGRGGLRGRIETLLQAHSVRMKTAQSRHQWML